MRLRSGVWVALFLSATAAAETRRIAIVVGNNAGTGTVAPLRYAENDAGKMARVLVELGEVDSEDVMLLQGRRMADVERVISDVKDRVQLLRQKPDVRTVVIFYFSGHSDGEAIELGVDKLPYARLKAMLQGTQADVRLVIIDACRSGGGIAQKGGKPAEGFTIKLADTLNATGDAFITSSAADEAALESSEVMGSYFTHNLISGMRGAADRSGDKQVTLQEAYQFAYERTVSATSVLGVGSQHPNYDFKLSGQGELVLSTLLKPTSLLVIPAAERSLVTDMARDQVVVEVPNGPAHEIALPAGQYGVRIFKNGKVYGSRVTLTQGQRVAMNTDSMQQTTASMAVAMKGGGDFGPAYDQPMPSGEVKAKVEPTKPVEPDSAPIFLGVTFGATRHILTFERPDSDFGPKYQLRLLFEPVQSQLASFNMFGRERLGRARLVGELMILGLGEMSFDAPLQGLTEGLNEFSLQARVGYRIGLEWGPVLLGFGVEFGVGALGQLYTGEDGMKNTTFILGGAPRITVRIKLGPVVSLLVEGDVSIVTYQVKLNGVDQYQWFGAPSASVGFAFAL